MYPEFCATIHLFSNNGNSSSISDLLDKTGIYGTCWEFKLSLNDMKIEPLRAFSDNYIWAISAENKLAVVDPGDANRIVT